jgi:PAS domain S-box-containing protein
MNRNMEDPGDREDIIRPADKLRRMTVLYELTTSIISITDFAELMKKIAVESVKFFNARGCVIRMLKNGKLKVEASTGFMDELRDELEIGSGLCGKAAEAGSTIYYSRAAESGVITVMPDIQVGICTPLRIGEILIGTFALLDKKDADGSVIAFDDEDRITIEGFASVAAIVIEKSLLLDNAVRQESAALEAKKQTEILKDYLEGLIENSPDAIVTTDLNGIVTSWNHASEKMFGYSAHEAIGQFLPSVPHFLVESEKHYLEQVKSGESIRDLETVRKTKDGRIIDVSFNMAAIRDSAGRVIGVSRIGRDITEKKRMDKDLMRKNTELSRLLFISSSMRGTLELDRLLRMVLTAVTVGDGLGFNRAMLFLVDEKTTSINGAMGVGPATHDEAWEIWSRLSMENKDIQIIMQDIEHGLLSKDSLMDRLCCGITIPLEDNTILTRSVKERKSFNIVDVMDEPLSDAVLTQQLGTMAYAVVPLISMDRVIGVLWVDNLFSRKPITNHDMEILKGFTDQIAAAIENARLFEEVARTEKELENIFESISDLMFINDSQYVLRKINKAFADKIGLPAEEIIGKKCYHILHGMDNPWELCPHHKTVVTGKPFVGEVDDPNLGGTFLISSSPLFEKSGELSGTVHIARDVTEIKKLKEKFVSVERMAALGEMAAKVAHEIRNPLLSIGGFARRLEKNLQENQKDNARIIVDEVRRLEGILNNILSFVRSSVTDRQEVLVDHLIGDISVLLGPAISERGNALIRDVEEGLGVLINYDRLKEALINLLNNANTATENGTIKIAAQAVSMVSEPDLLGQAAEHKEALIEISDTGHGIGAEDMVRIFDPFFTTRPTGTGLGLSITKRIIEEHGGRMEVRSTAGKGTSFSIYLPIKGGSNEDTGS